MSTDVIAVGEPLSSLRHLSWAHNILLMRDVLELWDGVTKQDNAFLSRRIAWRGKGIVNLLLEERTTGKEVLGLQIAPPETAVQWRHGDLFTPTRHYLAGVISRELEDLAAPSIEWDAGFTRQRISHAPKSLIGAMWLQFAFAFTGGKTYPNCKNCGRLFEISTDFTGKRPESMFCSAACKSQEFRRRKRTAREMAATGESLKAIAKQLRTKTAMVR